MIQKLKIKFMILSMSALLILLIVIIAGMNIMNYNSVVEEADSILSLLSQNKGEFPGIGDKPDYKLPPRFSPEAPYESRYFSVFYDNNGDVVYVDVSRISAIDRETAVKHANQITNSGRACGFISAYRYTATKDFMGTRITFLDCGRKLDAFRSFLVSSIIMSVIGYAIVFVVIFILADKILKPIAESYQKQKQFITDAGHEIKTPLTIINANVDILELEFEEPNESLKDIKEQTKRLKNLTEDLVMLSRMEEAETTMDKIEFPLSEVVTETVDTFVPLAANQNKQLQCDITPMLALTGNDKAIRQLVSIFMDNALKYSIPEGVINISLQQQNHSITLAVSNIASEQLNSEQLKNVFDRFYRTDSSRNSETGGHGIGLSIAKAIVTAHDGKIKASTSDGKTFIVTATFPQ